MSVTLRNQQVDSVQNSKNVPILAVTVLGAAILIVKGIASMQAVHNPSNNFWDLLVINLGISIL